LNIAVDARGGDHAPAVTVQGALWAQSELGVNITLVEDQDLLTGELSARKKTGNGIQIHHCIQMVAVDDYP